jgi:hypothetical protein
VIKPSDPSQKKSVGWLICVGVEVVNKCVNNAIRRLLHGACGIKVASFEYAVLGAEYRVHCIGFHDPVQFRLVQIRNGNRRTLTILSRVQETRLQGPIDLGWAHLLQNYSGKYRPLTVPQNIFLS